MIRPAERRDVAQIWAMIHELAEFERLTHAVTGNPELLERHIFEDRFCTVNVMEVDGNIVGYTLCVPIYSTFRTLPGLWLEDLYVKESQRGKGYGKALLTNLIESCKELKVGRLEWCVLDWNESAIHFYKAMGADVMPDWRSCRISFEV